MIYYFRPRGVRPTSARQLGVWYRYKAFGARMAAERDAGVAAAADRLWADAALAERVKAGELPGMVKP